MTNFVENAREGSPHGFLFIFIFCWLCFHSQIISAEDTLTRSLNEANRLVSAGQQSQRKINATIAETTKLTDEFKRLSKAMEQVNINLQHQTQIHQTQQNKLRSLDEQISKLSLTENSIVPLLFEMLDWLEQQINTDLPFHLKQRLESIAQLKKKLSDPLLPLAEQYRAILEVYQIESEYGYSIETYQDNITLNNQHIQAQVLKIGRIGLYYLSLDELSGGLWNKHSEQWEELEQSTLGEVRQAIQIAKKQIPPSLLSLPVYQEAHH